jgi:lactate dehydrogenase-like 2-hydroxyacid dehydrogenase
VPPPASGPRRELNRGEKGGDQAVGNGPYCRKEETVPHPALRAGREAVITGGASGIGFAAARRFASLGMKLCHADRREFAAFLAAPSPFRET